MPSQISKKIILAGHFGVGKTSLVKQFVFSQFSDEYLSTIGVRVDQKVVELDQTKVKLMIWDIEGNSDLERLPKSYFLGASGIIYVFDLTRPSTIGSLDENLKYLSGLIPAAKVKIAGNKADLLEKEELETTLQNFNLNPDIITSARTGHGVESLFKSLAQSIVE